MNRKCEMETVPMKSSSIRSRLGQMGFDGYKKQIHDYIKAHAQEMVETLKALIKIPSVWEPAEENAPFGSSIAHALTYVKGLYADNGFDTELDENGGFLLSYSDFLEFVFFGFSGTGHTRQFTIKLE